MPKNVKTILLPTDFSSNSYSAIKFAIQTFGYENNRYILTYALKTPHAGANVLVSVEDIMLKEATRSLEQDLEKIKSDFPDSKLMIFSKAVFGDVVFCVNAIDAQYEIDIVVIGTRGASGIKEKLIGSTTAELIKNIEKPVLVIPMNFEFQPLQHIIFASDNQKINDSELQFLKDLVGKYKSHVEILYVSKKAGTSMVTANPQRLEAQFDDSEYTYLKDSGNDVAGCIEKYLQKKKADLVTLTARHHDFLENIFHKSITQRLVMHAKYPMLILHD